MIYDYATFVKNKLEIIRQANSDLKKFEIEVTTEQAFLKMKELNPNRIYFLIKYLSATKTYNSEVLPIQIFALSEQNGLEATKKMLSLFADSQNFQEIPMASGSTTTIKQQYTAPVVMSNFNEISIGFRTVIYLSGTLYVSESIADLTDFAIELSNGATTSYVNINPLNTNLAYTMSGNTQPTGNKYIATTVKNVATLNISFMLPSISTTYGPLINKIMNIANGSTQDSPFKVRFRINGVKFGYFASGDTVLEMRLQSMQFATAPNTIPSIQVGLIE